jgi:uncharacterized membrane protein YphA (DoxX/SURF4 family)
VDELKLSKFLFGHSPKGAEYGMVFLRVIIALFWLNSDMPRWMAMTTGQLKANGIVTALFGPGMALPLTYFFTLLETLAAISLLLGLFTRLGALWGVIEFVITGSFGLSHGISAVVKDFGLWGGCVTLLLSGSPLLSLDGLIAKRRTRS